MSGYEVSLEQKESFGETPPSLFWVTPNGVVFQLYRLYHVTDSSPRRRWVALRVGSDGLVFPNESANDVRLTWQAAVGTLRPLGDAIKITIQGPGWKE